MCSFVLPALSMGMYASQLLTLPRSFVADTYREEDAHLFYQQKMDKAHTSTAVDISPSSLVLHVAGLRWWPRKSVVDFAWFCGLVVFWVTICKIRVECHFVNFHHTFSIEKAQLVCISFLRASPIIASNEASLE